MSAHAAFVRFAGWPVVVAGLGFGTAAAQIVDTPDEEIAGISVNYQEAEVGIYTLPDPLRLANGERVADARTWHERRRPEIIALLEEQQYGKTLARPTDVTFDLHDKGTPAFDGRALRKQVTIYFSQDRSTQYLDLVVYTPRAAAGRAPLLLQLGWSANNLAVQDPGVKVGRAWNAETKTRTLAIEGRPFGGVVDVPRLIERGYGVATFHFNDVEPDSLDSLAHGVRALYLKDGATAPAVNEWGAIAAWAWSASRVVDYLVTDAAVDPERIAILGVSRLGKTALWAAARDERIAAVIASVSGEGGAALSRRDYGETIAHVTAPTRYPYWFAPNYAKWAGRMGDAPFDSHFVLALIAPRPLLLQTGYTDKRADPYGEFLAAKAATPVYELLGAAGIAPQAPQPPVGEPIMSTLGYLMHDGGHGVIAADWDVFLAFLDEHLR